MVEALQTYFNQQQKARENRVCRIKICNLLTRSGGPRNRPALVQASRKVLYHSQSMPILPSGNLIAIRASSRRMNEYTTKQIPMVTLAHRRSALLSSDKNKTGDA